tara:strand:- start:157 stop:546 length:390 start_codon:yes stop_codon:yes gene_type:complete
MIKSDWSGKDCIKFTLLAVVMLLASDLSAKEKRNHQGLPAGDGIDLVLDNCTACHSTDIIRKNHMSREAWDKTITLMQQKQGLWELGKVNRKKILDYLENSQGISSSKDKPDTKQNNQMYEFDYRANPL